MPPRLTNWAQRVLGPRRQLRPHPASYLPLANARFAPKSHQFGARLDGKCILEIATGTPASTGPYFFRTYHAELAEPSAGRGLPLRLDLHCSAGSADRLGQAATPPVPRRQEADGEPPLPRPPAVLRARRVVVPARRAGGGLRRPVRSGRHAVHPPAPAPEPAQRLPVLEGAGVGRAWSLALRRRRRLPDRPQGAALRQRVDGRARCRARRRVAVGRLQLGPPAVKSACRSARVGLVA